MRVCRFLDPSLWNTTEALAELYSNEDFHEASRKHVINGAAAPPAPLRGLPPPCSAASRFRVPCVPCRRVRAGYMYCNLPNLTFQAGRRVRLHVMALGTQEDVHTPSIEGGTFLQVGAHGASVGILAGSMKTFDVVVSASPRCARCDAQPAALHCRHPSQPAGWASCQSQLPRHPSQLSEPECRDCPSLPESSGASQHVTPALLLAAATTRLGPPPSSPQLRLAAVCCSFRRVRRPPPQFTQPGTWAVECRVADHVLAGMEALYTVTPAPSGPLAVPGLTSRTYYLAAETVAWDYAPQGYVQCGAENFKEDSRRFIDRTGYQIGSKCV